MGLSVSLPTFAFPLSFKPSTVVDYGLPFLISTLLLIPSTFSSFTPLPPVPLALPFSASCTPFYSMNLSHLPFTAAYLLETLTTRTLARILHISKHPLNGESFSLPLLSTRCLLLTSRYPLFQPSNHLLPAHLLTNSSYPLLCILSVPLLRSPFLTLI